MYAVLMSIGAYNFRWHPRMGVVTSPAFTPILLSALVTILSCVLIGATLMKHGKVSLIRWFRGVVGDERMQRSLILIVLTGVYVFLIGRGSFIAVTTVYLFAMYWYLKIGSLRLIILYSLAAGLLVSVLIPYVFQMPLP